MKKYMVTYTDSITGGRDANQPYRANKQGTDKIEMFRFYEKCMNEQGKRYGWEEPILFEMDVTELDGGEALLELDEYEKTKNCGIGI